MHLVDLVWVVLSSNGFGRTRQVKLSHGHLHQSNAPVDEGIEISKTLLNVFDAAVDVPGEYLLGVGSRGRTVGVAGDESEASEFILGILPLNEC